MVCGFLVDRLARLSAKEGDTAIDRARKRFAAPVYLWIAVVATFASLTTTRSYDFWRVGMGAAAVLFTAGFILTLVSRIPPDVIFSFLALAGGCCALGIDLSNAAKVDMRTWSFMVLVIDMCLVLDIRDGVQVAVVALTLCYLTVERLESFARFGLYEATEFGTLPTPDVCPCDSPPCGKSASNFMLTLVGYFFVFLTDFALTRGFAVGLRRQIALVDSSVAAAERVAALLAAYQVTEAERVVAADGDALPPALRRALELLLANLKSYRPYLPDSLLSAAQAEAEAEAAAEGGAEVEARMDAPGLAQDPAEVCLCFTDIEASTALWESYPQGMYDALEIHNKVMRRTAAACNGYEVKTIGDAFMLAFDNAADACRFGVEAQRQLLAQQWPADLLEHELCTPRRGPDSEALLWGGLRVRVGINWGEVRVTRNPVTGRCDYFGGTVNVAARVESAVGRGGLVGVTPAVLRALGPKGLAELGSPAVVSLGSRQLKGVREAVELSLLLPPELAARATPASGMFSSNEATRSSRAQDRSLDSQDRQSSFSSLASSQAGSRQGSVMPTRAVAAGLGALVRHENASSATVRIPLHAMTVSESIIGAQLAAIEGAADISRGVVLAVLSCCCYITWNAAKPCGEHGAACARFMHGARRAPRVPCCHFGAASGEVSAGNVAAGRRCFATVIGGCIELSAALAEEAELCGDTALAAGAAAQHVAAAGGAHRAQLWADPEQVELTIWELPLDTGDMDASPVSSWADFLDPAVSMTEEQAAQSTHATRASDIALSAFRSAVVLTGDEQLQHLQHLVCEFPEHEELARLLLRASRGALRLRRTVALTLTRGPRAGRPGCW